MSGASRTGARVVVVGAGILGASIGYHLAQAAARVTIVDGHDAVGGATAASFAWINASHGNPQPYFGFRLQAMAEWRMLNEALGRKLPLRWGGSIEWWDEPEELRRAVAEQTAWGYPIRLIGRDEIAALEPAIATPPAEAAFAALEGVVAPVAATEILLEAAQALGASLRRGVPLEMTTDGGRVGLRLGGTRLEAERIVLAAGADCGPLLAGLGVDLPMANAPGLLVHTKPAPSLIQHLVLSPGAHVKQDVDGRLVVGETFGGGPVPDDHAAEAEKLLQRVRACLQGAEALEVERVTVGVRPIPRDGLPIIGAVAGLEGLFLAVMHSGITLAPLVGRLTAVEVLGGGPVEILAPYRLARFAAG